MHAAKTGRSPAPKATRGIVGKKGKMKYFATPGGSAAGSAPAGPSGAAAGAAAILGASLAYFPPSSGIPPDETVTQHQHRGICCGLPAPPPLFQAYCVLDDRHPPRECVCCSAPVPWIAPSRL